MEWVKEEGSEYAVIKVGGQAVWTAVVVTNGESWVPCVVRGAPGESADVLWPSDPEAATCCPSIEAAKKVVEEVLASWGRDLIDQVSPPVVVWGSGSSTLRGMISFECCDDSAVDVMVHQVAPGTWAAKVKWDTLRCTNGDVLHFASAREAQDAAEAAAFRLMRRGDPVDAPLPLESDPAATYGLPHAAPTMRWADVDERGRVKGRLDRGGIDVEVVCTACGDWLAKVNGKELLHDGAPRLFPSSAAQIAAEVSARSLWGAK